MQRISICAMKKNRKAILEELQSIGVLEIDAAELDPELKTMDTMNARLIFEKNASLCDQAIEILDEFSKEKQSMLASLAGKPLIGRKQEEEAIRDQEEILRTAREIQGYRKKLTENSAAAVKLEQQEAALAPWLKLDIPMNFGGTAKAAVLVGSIDGNITLDQVYSQLAADAPQLEAFDIREISNDAGKLSLVVVCLKAQAQELEEALRMQGFARPAQLVSEVPAQELENLKNEVVRIQEESEQIREQIRALHGRKSSLQLLSDYFRIRAQKYEVLGQVIVNTAQALGADASDSRTWCSVLLILLSVILTGFGIYPRIGKFGGAGSLVPITGFANSVAASAIEFRAEGQVFGIGCKIFTIAGPVILYGILSAWGLGVIYYILKILEVIS